MANDRSEPRGPDPGRRKRLPQGRYANYFEVGFNPFEFIVDFGQYQPETESAHWHTRIVLGPAYAKLLSGMLRGAMSRFEEENGEIISTEEDLDPHEVVRKSLEELPPAIPIGGPAERTNSSQPIRKKRL